MKRIGVGTVVLAAVATMVFAQGSPMSYVVKVSGFDGTEEYQALPADQYKMLKDEIKQESSFHMKAMMQAERKWKEDPANARKTFPKSAVEPRKIQEVGSFKTQEDAEKKKADIEARESEQEARKKERDAEVSKKLGKTVAKDKSSQAKKDAKEMEKEALDEQARTLYSQILDELKTAAQTPPSKDGAQKPDKDQ